VDTTTPQGAAMTQVLAVFAELERRLIGERTKVALAVKKAQGVKLGRPRTLPAEVIERTGSERHGWSRVSPGELGSGQDRRGLS
jgi:DNA invertase Pin-like site-specific DNA recombinase